MKKSLALLLFLRWNTNMKLSLLFLTTRFSGFEKQRHWFSQNSGTFTSWYKCVSSFKWSDLKNYMYLSTKIPKAKQYKTPGRGLFLLTTENLWAVFRDNTCFYSTSCKHAVGHLFLLELRQTRSILTSCSSPPLHRSFPGHTPFPQIYSSYKPCPFTCNRGVATF